MKENSIVKRGEVVIVAFGGNNAEFGKRPAVVVQNDVGNVHANSTIVVPITSKPKKKMPTHVWIGRESGMHEPGTALCEHVISVYKRDISKRVGMISRHEQRKIDEALKVSLDLIDELEGGD